MKKAFGYETPELIVRLICDSDMIRTSAETEFTGQEDDMTTTDKWGVIGG